MKKNILLIITFLIAQPAFSFVGSSYFDKQEEKGKTCLFLSEENSCDLRENLLLGGEGGGRPDTNTEEEEFSEYELLSLILEANGGNTGGFNLSLITKKLQEKYPYLTEEDVLEIYEQKKLFGMNIEPMSFSMRSERIAGGEGGN